MCSNIFAHLKNEWVWMKGAVFKLFYTSRCKYRKIKAEIQVHHRIFTSDTHIFSVQQNRADLVPILSEGIVSILHERQYALHLIFLQF